jgi:hypothetical protein
MSQLQNSLPCTNPMILAPARARRKLAYPTGHRQFAPGPGVAAKGRIWAGIGVLQLALMNMEFSNELVLVVVRVSFGQCLCIWDDTKF